jgi:hypothetical protein
MGSSSTRRICFKSSLLFYKKALAFPDDNRIPGDIPEEVLMENRRTSSQPL